MPKFATDIKQSNKLAEILPIETADIGWGMNRGKNASNIYGWSGIQVKWSIDSDNNRVLVRDYDASSKEWKEIKKFTKESWS